MVWCLFFYLTIRTLLHLLNIDFNKGPTTEMIVFVIVVYLGTLIAAIIVVSWRAKRKAEGKMPAWREAMERWNSLYYCARDGIVFDPETGAVAPISSETE
jgi:uncharacterized membrane protein